MCEIPKEPNIQAVYDMDTAGCSQPDLSQELEAKGEPKILKNLNFGPEGPCVKLGPMKCGY